MATRISDEACEVFFQLAKTSCPDGGLAYCYECTREAIMKAIALTDIHKHCVSLPNFTIDNTTRTSTNAAEASPCADGDFCRRVNGRIIHDRFCNSINHGDN